MNFSHDRCLVFVGEDSQNQRACILQFQFRHYAMLNGKVQILKEK